MKTFCATFKKIAYILISVALLFTALSLVRYDAKDKPEAVRVWGITDVVTLENTGYTATVGDAGLSCTPNAEDPYLLLSLNGESFDLVYLNFEQPISEMKTAVLYYSTDGSFQPSMSVSPRKSVDERQLIFCVPQVENGAALRLHLNGEFTLQGIELLQLGGSDPVPLAWNIRATVILAAALLILLLIERKFGYFAWLGEKATAEIAYCKELIAVRKRARLILHAVTLLSTAALVAMVGIFVLLGYFTTTTILGVFAGTLAVLALQLVDRVLSDRGAEPAKLFLTVTLLLGMMMCYAMPPALYVSWDDETHFRRSYDLVHYLDGEVTLAERRILTHRQFPVDSYAEDPQAFVYSLVRGESVTVKTEPHMSNPYTALSYLPMMLTQLLLWGTNADVLTLILLCRLANLLAYALITYFGIRKLKSGAKIFAAVAMLPTAFFLACSCNYDFFLTAWFAYAFATLIAALQRPDRKIGTADTVKIMVAFLMGCAPKAIYCFMMLPLLFLGRDRFESPKHAKRFRMWTLIVIGFILATLVVPGLVVPDLYTDTRGGSDVSSGGQIKFILQNPFEYAVILLRFLGGYCSLAQLNTSGTFFAYLGGTHTFFGTVAGFVLLYCVFTDRREGDRYERMQPTRWLMLAACFAQLVLIVTSLYVGYTPVGHDTINGCQYRYIFPLLIPFCFFLAPKGIKCVINPKFQKLFVFGCLAFSVAFSFFNAYLKTMI